LPLTFGSIEVRIFRSGVRENGAASASGPATDGVEMDDGSDEAGRHVAELWRATYSTTLVMSSALSLRPAAAAISTDGVEGVYANESPADCLFGIAGTDSIARGEDC
jgi:hypothetical protein